jgi:hypothetical protein
MPGNTSKQRRNTQQQNPAQAVEKTEYQVISTDWTFAIAPMMDWTDSKRAVL